MDVRIEVTGLEGLDEGGDYGAAFRESMSSALGPVMGSIVSTASAGTRYSFLAAGYQIEENSGGDLVEISIDNTHHLFPFLDSGVRAHSRTPYWIPWGPGTPLAEWAEARGIPPFLVARKIAREGFRHPGIRGEQQLKKAFEGHRDRLRDAVQSGFFRFLSSVGLPGAASGGGA
jgi:hypothetical protein